jgi:hypothetical protein
MKILLATVVLATLLGSSAYAQYGVWRGDYRAYAHVPPYATYRSYGFYRSPYLHSVYDVEAATLAPIRIPACAISCGEIPPRE